MEVKLPSVRTLASLAALASKNTDVDAGKAVDYAYELWEHAHIKLEDKYLLKLYDHLNNQLPPGLPSPKAFPAKFKEFLKVVVDCKAEGDSQARFKRFLREKSPERDPDKQVAEFRKKSFTISEWFSLAEDYRNWWKAKKSELAFLSAKKRTCEFTWPKIFPASFQQFLTLVVAEQTENLSSDKFCEFLRAINPNCDPEKELKNFSSKALSPYAYVKLGEQYSNWKESKDKKLEKN
jgi:hypothetical protein